MANVTRSLTMVQVAVLDLPYTCHTTWLTGDEHRWWYGKAGVFKLDGSDWMIEWMEPATEEQEGQDIWYENGVVTATKVMLLPVVKKEWLPVED